jgi:hypothetical protein
MTDASPNEIEAATCRYDSVRGAICYQSRFAAMGPKLLQITTCQHVRLILPPYRFETSACPCSTIYHIWHPKYYTHVVAQESRSSCASQHFFDRLTRVVRRLYWPRQFH